MATPVSDLRAPLKREINVPGIEALPDLTDANLDGYIKDGFWEAKLLGMLSEYTQTDGTELATPIGEVIKRVSDDGDLPQELHMLVVLMAAMRLLRAKILNLSVNFRAQGGPVSYEQQASATVLRTLLGVLEARVAQVKELYSDKYSPAFVYFDGELQREAALLNDYASLQVF